ncbi:MAG TPA: hypothetical protein VHX60_08915 [Acidobacteriaceae bacterium]|jgi:hypothetical protein|nr:hypothetical protein [Acidobacteriaceae bacterium]
MMRHPSHNSKNSGNRWIQSQMRAMAPRRFFRVLPTRTRPSLFGSD